MNDTMDRFFNCVNKTLVEDILNGDGEYLVRTSRQDDEVERLIAALGKDMALRVDDLLSEQRAIGELREWACFQAGFRIALELTR